MTISYKKLTLCIEPQLPLLQYTCSNHTRGKVRNETAVNEVHGKANY